jgi:hypothetical protein
MNQSRSSAATACELDRCSEADAEIRESLIFMQRFIEFIILVTGTLRLYASQKLLLLPREIMRVREHAQSTERPFTHTRSVSN